MRVLRRFAIGKDFREEDFHKWIDQLIWWIGDRFPRIRDPREHAEKIMKAALNGTKLDGSEWVGISDDFFQHPSSVILDDHLSGYERVQMGKEQFLVDLLVDELGMV